LSSSNFYSSYVQRPEVSMQKLFLKKLFVILFLIFHFVLHPLIGLFSMMILGVTIFGGMPIFPDGIISIVALAGSLMNIHGVNAARHAPIKVGAVIWDVTLVLYGITHNLLPVAVLACCSGMLMLMAGERDENPSAAEILLGTIENEAERDRASEIYMKAKRLYDIGTLAGICALIAFTLAFGYVFSHRENTSDKVDTFLILIAPILVLIWRGLQSKKTDLDIRAASILEKREESLNLGKKDE
jgi:hypothetical protein